MFPKGCRMRPLRYVFAVLLLIGIFYFSKTPRDLLIGKWQATGGRNGMIEFMLDGSYVHSGIPDKGQFHFIDANKITIDTRQCDTLTIVRISTRKLTLCNQRTGDTNEYTKID